MNIRDLTYFLAVVKHCHFGKAAEVCCVSQPALSMQLKKLEEELGAKLFERTNKSVMVTPLGHDVAKRARNIINERDAIKELAKASGNPFAGRLKLGAFPTLGPYIFPKVIRQVKKQYKELTLLLVEEKTDVLISQLLQGNLDAALIALPVNNDKLHEQALFFDPFLLAVSKQHAFSEKKSATEAMLNQETLLLLDDGHCLRDQALSVCNLGDPNGFRATSMETLRQMVASDVGITLIPKTAQRKGDHIIYLPFSSKRPPGRHIGLLWRKTSPRETCITAIAELIQSVMGAESC